MNWLWQITGCRLALVEDNIEGYPIIKDRRGDRWVIDPESKDAILVSEDTSPKDAIKLLEKLRKTTIDEFFGEW